MTRRGFLQSLGGIGLAGAAVCGYGSTVAVHDLRIERITVPVPGLAGHLAGTKIVHVSDLHAGTHVSDAYLEQAFKIVGDLAPDYLTITGDFVNSTISHLPALCRMLSPLTARIPTYGCTGNHEFSNGHYTPQGNSFDFADAVCAQLSDAGVHMLRNAIHQPKPGSGELCFIGLEDFLCGYPDPGTLRQAPPEAAKILLSHTPDSYELVAPFDFDLMLCGHTHGGQVCIPGLGPIILPVEHRERAQGIFHLDPAKPHRAMYVTRGVGHLIKIRLFCPPEITVITLMPVA